MYKEKTCTSQDNFDLKSYTNYLKSANNRLRLAIAQLRANMQKFGEVVDKMREAEQQIDSSANTTTDKPRP